MLDYSQIKAGKFRKHVTRFCVREAVEDVISLQRDLAQRKGITLGAKFNGFDSKDDFLVHSDQQRLMQVILNLQSNAIKFTMRGSVTIEVSKCESVDDWSGDELDDYRAANDQLFNFNPDQKDEYLKVAVRDTGIGIKQEDQQKLFQLFGFV